MRHRHDPHLAYPRARSPARRRTSRFYVVSTEDGFMIPAWDTAGVIPPIAPGEPGASPLRAPYRASMVEVVRRYGTSDERRVILHGLLAFRRALAAAGLADCFQWLDGSFVEDVETLRSRPPADIDVVTFAHLGGPVDQAALLDRCPELFDPAETKARFSVDAFYRNSTTGWTTSRCAS